LSSDKAVPCPSCGSTNDLAVILFEANSYVAIEDKFRRPDHENHHQMLAGEQIDLHDTELYQLKFAHCESCGAMFDTKTGNKLSESPSDVLAEAIPFIVRRVFGRYRPTADVTEKDPEPVSGNPELLP